jgi:hypothetical protein
LPISFFSYLNLSAKRTTVTLRYKPFLTNEIYNGNIISILYFCSPVSLLGICGGFFGVDPGIDHRLTTAITDKVNFVTTDITLFM